MNRRKVVPPVKDLVLVGGGHSHVIALRMLAMRPIAGLRITLVSPDSHTPYSGMLPGLIAGHYTFDESHIDLDLMCQWAGARYIPASACGLDPASRRVQVEGRADIEYDVLSLDIGSQPELDSVQGARAYTTPVKPVSVFWHRWQRLCETLKWHGGIRRIAVVGGGAGSVELVLAMAQALQQYDVSFSLISAADTILPEYNSLARAAVAKAMARYNIEIISGQRVDAVSKQGALSYQSKTIDSFDEIIWCTGGVAAPWVSQCGLSTTEQGFLALRDTLQSVDDDRVFGAGDVAVQLAHPRPRAGVFAVRQGPVLATNLRRFLLGRRLRQYRPQRRFLSLLSLGEKRATADRGVFCATGEWVWRWKDRIDRRFMQAFQNFPQMMPRGYFGRLPAVSKPPEQAPCGGCGAKIAADDLASVLHELHQSYPEQCPAPGEGDDVAQIPAPAGEPVYQSIDVLRELVNDPFMMGQIAAQHALSDLYASGLRPVSALATVTLPFGDEQLQRRDLKQLLAGAVDVMKSAGCVLSGGHSFQGSELALGFTVNGVIVPNIGRLLTKRGLRIGDKLLLTKPLGSGVLFAGRMQLATIGRAVNEALTAMLMSNQEAARLALHHGVVAATDVTGFGFACHAMEMLAPGQGLVVDTLALPQFAGARSLLQGNMRSSLHEVNRRAAQAMGAKLPDASWQDIVFDPQTSGGLLIAVPGNMAASLLNSLQSAGYDQAAIVAEVVPEPADTRIQWVGQREQ